MPPAHGPQLLCAAHDLTQAGPALGSRGGTVSVWDVEAGVRTAHWEGARGHVSCVAPLLDGRGVLSGGADGCVRLHGLPDCLPGLCVQTGLADINQLLQSADANLLLACGDGSRALVLDLRMGARPLLTVAHGASLAQGEAVNGVSACWLPHTNVGGAQLLASAADDGCVCLWDVGLGSPLLQRTRAHTQPASCLAVGRRRRPRRPLCQGRRRRAAPRRGRAPARRRYGRGRRGRGARAGLTAPLAGCPPRCSQRLSSTTGEPTMTSDRNVGQRSSFSRQLLASPVAARHMAAVFRFEFPRGKRRGA